MRYLSTIFPFLVILVLTFSGCNKQECIEGSGTNVTQTLTVAPFTGIDLTDSYVINISQGATQEVVVVGQPNIIEKLRPIVVNGVCRFSLENGCYNPFDLTINVTVPEINFIELSGSGNATVNNFVNQNDLDIRIGGSGNVILNEFGGCENLDARISGSGEIFANEDFEDLVYLDVLISGSGNYNGFAIETDDCTIDISGSGGAKTYVRNNLHVDISGSGTVSYKGNPTITSDISGSGEIINAN